MFNLNYANFFFGIFIFASNENVEKMIEVKSVDLLKCFKFAVLILFSPVFSPDRTPAEC